jgi:PAS domain-containing protein
LDRTLARALHSTFHDNRRKAAINNWHRRKYLTVGRSNLLSDDERFQFLVDALSDHAIVMLDSDGTVISWNAGAQRITGYRSGEIVGANFSQFFTLEDRDSGVPAEILGEAETAGRA